jgi:hypothetical protein
MISPALNRKYSDPTDLHAISLLNTLIDSDVDVASYRESMFKIGQHLGSVLRTSIDKNKKYCVAVTAEDADFLAKGILESLKEYDAYIACFWNERSSLSGNSVAPILSSYLEKGYESADNLIVVKSIISGSCVVKTNITALFSTISPKEIHVVAPVMHESSEKKLESEFSKSIADLFQYTYLAKDSKRMDDGEVYPGIGGDVYKKLGFTSQENKNSFMPELIANKMFA